MANIKKHLDNIKGALFGKDVRSSIHDGIDAINKEVESTTNRQEHLEDTFDQLVINSGNSNAEIVDARVGENGKSYAKLGDRLDEVDSQLEHIEKFSNTLIRKNISHNFEKVPVITFIDDDNKADFLNLIKPIFDKYNIKGSLAVITDNVGKSGYLNEGQLKELQEQGYTIMSHSKSHNPNVFKGSAVDLGAVADSEVLNEYREAYNWLSTRGFKGADTIVYPWGNFGEHSRRFKDLARNFYNNGVNASGGLNTSQPNDNMYLNRQFIQSAISLDTYKTLIDECVSKKGWLIFGTHSNNDEIDQSHFNSVVSYAVNSGAKILPFLEANELKANALSIGEFESDNSFYVSKHGDIKANNFKQCSVYSYEETKDMSMDVMPTSFKKGIHSICIKDSNDTLTNLGGNLILHNNGGDFTYETFVPFGTTKMYIRQFNFRSSPQKWDDWQLINSSEVKKYNVVSLNSEYTLGTIRVRQDFNTVAGTIRLVNESKDGTFQHATHMAKIENLQLPYYCIIPCVITTAEGEILNGALEAQLSDGSTIFKCHGSVGRSNIRWIDFNFTFNIHV